jgi:hypothetical protein
VTAWFRRHETACRWNGGAAHAVRPRAPGGGLPRPGRGSPRAGEPPQLLAAVPDRRPRRHRAKTALARLLGITSAHLHERMTELTAAGTLERRLLARLVHANLWGPGRFTPALREAVAQGKVRRAGRGLYELAPATPGCGHDPPPAGPTGDADAAGEPR